VSGLFTDYHYYGAGDVGGAPDEASVKLLESTVTNAGGGPLHVVSATAEQMFLDIKPNQTARLPRYKGEMELTNHSAGSLTSEAYLKRGIARTSCWPMPPRRLPSPPSCWAAGHIPWIA